VKPLPWTTRQQHLQLQRISAVERKFANAPLVDDLAQGAADRFDAGGGACHGHRFGDRADGHRDVHLPNILGVESKRRRGELAKALQLRFDAIAADRKPRKVETPRTTPRISAVDCASTRRGDEARRRVQSTSLRAQSCQTAFTTA